MNESVGMRRYQTKNQCGLEKKLSFYDPILFDKGGMHG